VSVAEWFKSAGPNLVVFAVDGMPLRRIGFVSKLDRPNP
jgi:hypothetical protein